MSRTDIGWTLAGSVALAAVSTLGDFIWATWILGNRPVYGISHGAILFLCMGLVLGLCAKKPATGALAGAAIGSLAATGFYVLAPIAGYSIMFLLWVGVWIALGVLNGRLNTPPSGIGTAVARGVFAAVASGVAFYLISGIWRPFRPQGWDYLVHFGAWTFAYLPGFAGLLVARRPHI
jgi:hypothetical protein